MNEQNLRPLALADDNDLIQAAPDSGVTIAGATGLEPAKETEGSRSASKSRPLRRPATGLPEPLAPGGIDPGEDEE
jgi:hypothetical protein